MGERTRATGLAVGLLLTVGGIVASIWYAWTIAASSATCPFPYCSTSWSGIDSTFLVLLAIIVLGIGLSLRSAYQMGRASSDGADSLPHLGQVSIILPLYK